MNTAINNLKSVYAEVKEYEWTTVKQKPPNALKKLPWSTDHVFLLHHLRYYTRIRVYREIFHDGDYVWDEEHYNLVRGLLRLRKPHVQSNSVLAAYERTLDLAINGIRKETHQEVSRLITFVVANQANFSKEDWVDIFSMIGNLCTSAINTGLASFVKLNFRAQVHQVEKKYGIEWKVKRDPFIPPNIFMNIVTLALRSDGKADWAQLPIQMIENTIDERDVNGWLDIFIAKYKSRIAPTFREVYVNFAKAKMAFHESDFFLTQKFLVKADRSSIDLFNLDLERLRMMNTYELHQLVGKSKRHLAARREFNVESPARINRFRSQLGKLKKDEKYQQQVDHFTWFINGFAAIYSLHRKYSDLSTTPESVKEEHRDALLFTTTGVAHPVKNWLLEQLK